MNDKFKIHPRVMNDLEGSRPDSIQMTDFNGRSVTYPSSTSSLGIRHELYDSPPPYSTAIANDVNFDNFNEKRRDFFFHLKDRLAEFINQEDRSPRSDINYNKDGHGQSCDCRSEVLLRDCLCLVTLCLSEIIRYCCYERTGIPEGMKQFATRTALGLSYIYQDVIPKLDAESNKKLAEYFCSLIKHCLFDPTSDYKPYLDSIYGILMSSLTRCDASLYSSRDLKTVDGFTLSFDHLLSMGVRTIDGGIYVPVKTDNAVRRFNELQENNIRLYRWGTSDVKKVNLNLDINLGLTIFEQLGSYNAFPKERVIGEFWKSVDNLAKQFLNPEDFQTYVQQLAVANMAPLPEKIKIYSSGGRL